MAGAPFPNFPIGTIGAMGQDVSPFFQGMQLWQQQQLEAARRQQAAEQFAQQMAFQRVQAGEQSRLAELGAEERRAERAQRQENVEADRADSADYRAEQARLREEELGFRKTELEARQTAQQQEDERRARAELELKGEREAAKAEKAKSESEKQAKESAAYAVETAIAQYAGDPTDANALAEHLRMEGQRQLQADPNFNIGVWNAVANERVQKTREGKVRQDLAELDRDIKKMDKESLVAQRQENAIRQRVGQANKVLEQSLRIVETNVSKNEQLLALMGDPGDDPAKINRVKAIGAALDKFRAEQARLLRQMAANEARIRGEMGQKYASEPAIPSEAPQAPREELPQRNQQPAGSPQAAPESAPQGNKTQEAYDEYVRLNQRVRAGANAFDSKAEYDRAVKRRAELERMIRYG